MADLDLAAIKAKAEAADAECGGLCWRVNGKLSIRAGTSRYIAKAHWDGAAAAQHVVAAQPRVVLGLIKRVEDAEAEVERLTNNAIAAEECAKLYTRDVEEFIVKPRDAELSRLRSLLSDAEAERASLILRLAASEGEYQAEKSVADDRHAEIARLRALLAKAGRALNEADTWTDAEHDVADWRDAARTVYDEIKDAMR